jgi:hypothetical protein
MIAIKKEIEEFTKLFPDDNNKKKLDELGFILNAIA